MGQNLHFDDRPARDLWVPQVYLDKLTRARAREIRRVAREADTLDVDDTGSVGWADGQQRPVSLETELARWVSVAASEAQTAGNNRLVKVLSAASDDLNLPIEDLTSPGFDGHEVRVKANSTRSQAPSDAPKASTAPTGVLVGYARCSTIAQDLEAQRDTLQALGVDENRIYVDEGLSGASRDRPGLDQALAAVRAGDTLIVPKLDRLARSVVDARAIADQLIDASVTLSLGGTVYNPDDPMGKMFFNILATFAEFERDLISQRTREGMAIARKAGKLRGRQPKLTAKQSAELRRMHATGEHTSTDIAEIFGISRATVYRTINRTNERGPVAS